MVRIRKTAVISTETFLAFITNAEHDIMNPITNALFIFAEVTRVAVAVKAAVRKAMKTGGSRNSDPGIRTG